MARNTAVLCLAVALLAVFTGNAAAIIGKGGHGKAVGGGISLTVPKLSFETSCKDVCGDRCTLSPKQTCNDVSVPYQECKSVPETTTVKQCKKVCTIVTETPAPTTTIKEIPSIGKGKLISLGKGRHLMGKGLPMISFSKGGFGKGSSNQSCKDECADVPVTRSTIKCESKTRTVQRCSTSFEKSCSQVCRQMCSKVPVVSHEQISIGKGKGH